MAETRWLKNLLTWLACSAVVVWMGTGFYEMNLEGRFQYFRQPDQASGSIVPYPWKGVTVFLTESDAERERLIHIVLYGAFAIALPCIAIVRWKWPTLIR
jgi:hypothetical protein